MRKLFALFLLLLASVAFASSPVFRERIREMQGGYRIWQRDDGGVVTEISCTLQEQETVDGGAWPLKNTTTHADGGNPNPVFSSCARLLETLNGLDGGLL